LLTVNSCKESDSIFKDNETQEPVTRSGESGWDYPVKPGTEEWASFTTGEQMLKACQIPQSILETLSTKELAEICMNYPLFFEYIFIDDEREGINIMIENFNGLKELSKRPDGVLELVNVYKNYPVLTQIQDETSKDYDTPYKLPFLELLLANDIFISQLDTQITTELGKIVLEKYERKLENAHVYSMYNIKKTFLLGAVVLSKQKPGQQDIVKRFIDNYNNLDENLLTEISKIMSEL
ncbi:MAG: hypothetical protein LBV47_07120, partial [Bacteroidales bacterium]|nr:hypothetical protein [Bacteroidales bacterium]